MPVVAVPNLPTLQAKIKTAFDNAVTAAGATPGPNTSAVNSALATEIANAINAFVEASKVTVTVTTNVTGLTVTGDGVTGTGAGQGVS